MSPELREVEALALPHLHLLQSRKWLPPTATRPHGVALLKVDPSESDPAVLAEAHERAYKWARSLQTTDPVASRDLRSALEKLRPAIEDPALWTAYVAALGASHASPVTNTVATPSRDGLSLSESTAHPPAKPVGLYAGLGVAGVAVLALAAVALRRPAPTPAPPPEVKVVEKIVEKPVPVPGPMRDNPELVARERATEAKRRYQKVVDRIQFSHGPSLSASARKAAEGEVVTLASDAARYVDGVLADDPPKDLRERTELMDIAIQLKQIGGEKPDLAPLKESVRALPAGESKKIFEQSIALYERARKLGVRTW